MRLFGTLDERIRVATRTRNARACKLNGLDRVQPSITSASGRHSTAFQTRCQTFVLPLVVILVKNVPIRILRRYPRNNRRIFQRTLTVHTTHVNSRNTTERRAQTSMHVRANTRNLRPFGANMLDNLQSQRITSSYNDLKAGLLKGDNQPCRITTIHFITCRFLQRVTNHLNRDPPFSFIR